LNIQLRDKIQCCIGVGSAHYYTVLTQPPNLFFCNWDIYIWRKITNTLIFYIKSLPPSLLNPTYNTEQMVKVGKDSNKHYIG